MVLSSQGLCVGSAEVCGRYGEMAGLGGVSEGRTEMVRPWDWWVLLVLGVLAILAGIVAIVYPFVSALMVTKILGVILIVGAVVHLVRAAMEGRGAWSIILGLVVSLLYVAAGVYLLTSPLRGLFMVTVVIGTLLVVTGLVELAMALEAIGRRGWGWTLVGSLLAIGLGIWILAELPWSMLWALGLVVGVNLLFTGLRLIAASSLMHRLGGMTHAAQT